MIKEFWGLNLKNRFTVLEQEDLQKVFKKKKYKKLTLAGNVRGYRKLDFSPLKDINIELLIIEDAVTQEQFEQICTLDGIIGVSLQHVGKIEDFSSISNISSLELLTLGTPIGWINKTHDLVDVKPLLKNKKLRKLQMAGVVFKKSGMTPLEGLKHLSDVTAPYVHFDEIVNLPHLSKECRKELEEYKKSIESYKA